MRSAVVAGGLLFAFATAACHRSTLPHALDDRAFWALSESLSEFPGSFPLSDNLVSNEPRLAENVRWSHRRGGVYIGVGPEQNFTYIARLRPSTAFIIDIRRENRSLHLLYKALFEISHNRADFISPVLASATRGADVERARAVREVGCPNRRPRSCVGARSRSSANAWLAPTASRCRRTISTGSSKHCTPSTGTDPTSTSEARGPALRTRSGRRTGS
jgi:hypothetical protein